VEMLRIFLIELRLFALWSYCFRFIDCWSLCLLHCLLLKALAIYCLFGLCAFFMMSSLLDATK
jgi:hypothetical protein